MFDENLFLNKDQKADVVNGRELLFAFFSVVRTANYHSANNVAMFEPSRQLVKWLRWFVAREDTKASLVVGNGQAFAGTLRIRITRQMVQMAEDLGEILEKRKLGGITFLQELNEEQVRLLAHTIINFRPPPDAEDGVEAFAIEAEKVRLGAFVEGMPPQEISDAGGFGGFMTSTELGALVGTFAKGYALIATMQDGHESSATATAIKHFLRELDGAHQELLDSMLGIVMLAGAQDMAMRSLTSLLVGTMISDQFGATREVQFEMGYASFEMARWDIPVLETSKTYGYEMAGAAAFGGINRHRTWTPEVIRRFITVASRYLPGEGLKPPEGMPAATRAAEIMRVACDYVDLCTPTPLNNAEPLFEGAPLAPLDAVMRMFDQVDSRYADYAFAGLVRGVGLLPMGFPVETADGAGSIIVKRTTDPLTFIAKDAVTMKEREVAFMKGPNEIVNIVMGAELLQVRSRVLIGDDYDALQQTAEELEEAGRNWS